MAKLYMKRKKTKTSKKKFKKAKYEATGAITQQRSLVQIGTVTQQRVPRNLMGDMFKATLNYLEYDITVNPTLGGVVAEYVFSANGLFDPNITGTGHQPLGFDQLMTFYSHYTVIASKIIVRFNNADTNNNQLVGVYCHPDATALTDPRVIIENGYGVYTVLSKEGVGDSSQATMSDQVSIAKFMGRPNILSEDDLRGSAVANPADQCFWHVWAGPNSTADSTVVGLVVRLEYVTIFTEPQIVSLS